MDSTPPLDSTVLLTRLLALQQRASSGLSRNLDATVLAEFGLIALGVRTTREQLDQPHRLTHAEIEAALRRFDSELQTLEDWVSTHGHHATYSK